MNSFQIADIRKFMSQMLLHDTFDAFTLSEATVKTAASFVVDGKINADFFDDDSRPEEEYIQYGKIRGFFYDIIKGRSTPVYFKFVFHAPESLKEQIISAADTSLSPSDVNALTFTATFKDGELTVLSGTNMSAFSLDRTIDQQWDRYVENFLDTI